MMRLLVPALLLACTVFASDISVSEKTLTEQPTVVAKLTGKTFAEVQDKLTKTEPQFHALLQSGKVVPTGVIFVHYQRSDEGVAVEVDLGAILKVATTTDGQFLASQLPAGPVATAEVDFADFSEGFRAVNEWIAVEGKEIAGPPWVTYLADERIGIFIPIK